MNLGINGTNNVKTVKKVLKKKRTQRQLRNIRLTIEALVATSTKKDAARMLKCTETNLFKRLSQYPEIMEGVSRFVESVRSDARRKLQLTSPVAVDKMVNLLEANSENVQLEASKQILDRSGISAPSNDTNIQVNVMNKLDSDAKDYDL